MTESKPTAIHRWLRRLALWALPVYWITLFCLTHYPRVRLPFPVKHGDKYIHAIAYALLSLLLIGFAYAKGWQLSKYWISRAGILLAAYGAFDELTQELPYINRNGDPLDWVFDMIGVVLVLVPTMLIVNHKPSKA